MADMIGAALDKAARAFEKVRKNPKNLAFASLSDIVFFAAYGFVTAPLFSKIVDYIIIMGTMVSEESASIARGTNPDISSVIIGNPQIRQYFNRLLIIYIILIAAIYMVYTFFQGISWKLSSNIAGRKARMHSFMREFALLNILWVGLFAVYHFISLFADLRQAAVQSMQLEASNAFGVFASVFLFAILYFAFISYTLIGKHTTKEKIKKAFYLGTRKISNILPAYLVMAAVYFCLKFLLEAFSRVNFSLMVVVGMVTVIPAMTWARVYLTMVTEKAK